MFDYKKRLVQCVSVLLCSVSVSYATPASSTPPAETNNQSALPVNEMQNFTRVLYQIKKFYVKDTKDDQLFQNAIKGMVGKLDPHSAYLDASDFEDLKINTSGEFGGVGMEVTMDNGFIKVVTPLDGTPAKEADIRSKDLIIRLDDTPVQGLSLREAVDIMRGKVGESVVITILREGEPAPLIKTIKRAKIKVSSTKQKLIDDHYGYIRISHFQEKTKRNVEAAIKKLKKESKNKLWGLIIDLRNNPGGLLSSAVDISDLFLEKNNLEHKQLIVYTKGRVSNARSQMQAVTQDITKGLPLIILVNEGSASASEIVAGALQDHERAIVLGTKTFGKGSVQTVLPLSENTALKLTTALYYTPKGRAIQAEGILPDIVIENLELEEKKSKSKLRSLRENSLTGHLNKRAQAEKEKQNKSTEKNKNTSISSKHLITEDYQLNEAVNLLKGLHYLQQKKKG